MKTIRRYHLQPTKTQTVQLPAGSEILSVQAKGDDSPVLWALIDPERDEQEERTVTLYATATEMPDNPGRYCGSFQIYEGSLEFHAFESVATDNPE